MGVFFFFQAEDGIRDGRVTGVQTCALPISCLTSSISERASKAASAAIWESVGTEIARFCCRRSIGRTSAGGTTIQPTRHPVMQKYFENELITTARSDSTAAVSAAKA